MSEKEFREYLKKQKEEILGEENRKKTEEHLGRPANDEELAMHFIESGAAEEFSRRWRNKM